MKKNQTSFHRKVITGIELEGYTITSGDYKISRKLAFHRKGTTEKGEFSRRDWSIGTEYNSRPFSTIREGLFLVKSGLRKYDHSLYRSKTSANKKLQMFLVGGWKDRFAGAHIHVSIEGEKLSYERAKKLASHIHDHLPLLIAISANSPVWGDKLTENASNRVLKGSKTYFKPIRASQLSKKDFAEMTYNRARKTKPPTLEIRILDSNLPEFTVAAVCIVKACVLAFLKGKKRSNVMSHYAYLKNRTSAAKHGMKAKLCWHKRYLSATDYLDHFVWSHREELKMMDIPQEIWATFKLLKKGINGETILREAIEKAYNQHPQTWQKRFAKKYVSAMSSLLSGNTLKTFMEHLDVKAPDISEVWLGRKKLKLL